ncbi:MAG TPA: hypothetical protein VGF95_02790 [Solirubrobacteraceae bacterium]
MEVAENRRFVERLTPAHEGDWLIVCGDVGEGITDIEWALATLTRSYTKLIWVPGTTSFGFRRMSRCHCVVRSAIDIS